MFVQSSPAHAGIGEGPSLAMGDGGQSRMEISGDTEGLALVHGQTNLGSPGHWGLHWGQAREML